MAGGLGRYPEGTPFPGVIGRTVTDSVPAWPESARARPGAPNVLVVLLDDVGFAQLGCFGADIRTPTFDRLAGGGLRYRQFHTTTLCAPSRACLLTGRNHHSNGMGVIPSAARGFPGYDGVVPRENGFISEILRGAGYATFALGKWHLAPHYEEAAGASKARWPLGRGFDRFYGFIELATSQFVPSLVYDNHPIAAPKTPEEGYHLDVDMADRAIEFITDLRVADPDQPFFMYYCPGACHVPHHVPREWADRYAGQFDVGWDRYREAVFARQLEMGVVPAGTTLPPRPEWIAAWDSLPAAERRLYARQMEVFAGFLEHTDHHIGRVVDFLEQIGELDNTLILVTSDNGADGAGGPHGNNGYRAVPESNTLEANLRLLDKWGGPETFPLYSWGWAWAGNTPLRRWKKLLHEGGISDPLIVHWPAEIASPGEVRDQYAHITDIAPTILDVLDIEPPAEIRGVAQSPIHGVSFAHSFDDAEAPTRKKTQYYEMTGSRAIWSDGWKAVTEQQENVVLTEEELARQEWELYRVADDFSESHDLAHEFPDKLQELIEQWWHEAGKHNALPLDAGWGRRPERAGEPRHHVYYPGAAPVSNLLAAPVTSRSHRITAHVEIPDGHAEGVLLAQGGGPFGGCALYVKDHRLQYVHNYAGLEEYRVIADTNLPTGSLALGLEFTKTEDQQGTVTLSVNGHEAAQGLIPRTMPVTPRGHLCCGYDGGQPVTKDYQAPFRFTGTITRVEVEVI